MSLLSPPPEPSNKYKALTYTGVALLITLAVILYFAFRYYPEKRAAEHFLDALVASHEKQAYEMWKPSESYKIGDFMADWGPEGYYGPVKSYSIVKAASGKGANGVVLTVQVSPFSASCAARDRHTNSQSLAVRRQKCRGGSAPNATQPPI